MSRAEDFLAYFEAKTEKLSKDDERIGQYASKSNAQKTAKRQTKETGQQHRIEKTICYRVDKKTDYVKELECWTIVLDNTKKRYYY